MLPALSRLTKVVGFLALFLLLERLLDRTGFRVGTLNALVDSLSLDTGIRPAYLDFAVVGIAAGVILWLLTVVCRSLYALMKP